ncbi:MAG: hypothetical protein U9N30_05860 [Campylobacterota bacterium]|nr:hypothetical protein [Campylobacterota bacterium]
MKKLYSVTLAAGLVLSTVGCVNASPSVATAAKMDTVKVCSVEANGLEKVIATAAQYNAVAIKEGVEFRRLGVNNSTAIAALQEAVKTGAKTIKPKNYKGKDTKNTFTVTYAAQRACKFAIAALQQKAEGQAEWRLAVPGDGFKY